MSDVSFQTLDIAVGALDLVAPERGSPARPCGTTASSAPGSFIRSGRCSSSYSSLKSASRWGSTSIMTQNTYGVFPVSSALPPTHS